MNLKLDVLNTDQLPDIIVRPYEYSYEELVDIINEQEDELTLLEFDRFCAKFDKELNDWNNIFVLNGYISEHGVDQAVAELFGAEGLVGDVKNAIVSFAKWLWKQFRKLVDWIMKLFGNDKKLPPPTEKDLDNPRLFVFKTISDKPNVKAAGAVLKKLSTDKKMTISIPKGLKPMAEIAYNLSGTMQDSIYSWESAKKYMDVIPKIVDCLKDDVEIDVERNNAEDYYIACASLTYGARSYALGILHVLTKILKDAPKDNLSEAEAVKYVNKVKTELKIASSDNSVNADSFKQNIQAIRSICGVAIRCSDQFVKWGVKIVTQMMHKGASNTSADLERGYNSWNEPTIHELIATKFAGVDVVASVPPIIVKKLNDAWKRKFKVQRIIISNVRGVGIAGKIGALGGNSGHVGLPNVEVSMSATIFAEKLGLRNLCSHARKVDPNADNTAMIREITEGKYNRVDLFMTTLVHELRHTWQSQTDFKYGKVVIPGVNGTTEEYENSAHEVDARQAAKNYKVDDADRKWVKELLLKVLQSARKNRNKYRTK